MSTLVSKKIAKPYSLLPVGFEFVFSVPLFYHMSAPAQRLLLSFVYVHRRNIPSSVLADFISALVSSVAILPTSEWIKTLLELLQSFCLSRMKDSAGERCGRGRLEVGYRNQVQSDECQNVSVSEYSGLNVNQQTEAEKDGDLPRVETEMTDVACFSADIIVANQLEKPEDTDNVKILAQRKISV